MKKEVISDKQGITLIMLFIIGSAVVLIPGLEAKKDTWLAVLLAAAFAFPVTMVYSRLLYLFPGSDIFDILKVVLGRWIGGSVSLLFIWFAFHLGALVLWNFGTFISTVGLKYTPMIIPMACIALLCTWGVKEGIEVLGKFCEFFIIIIAVIFAISLILLLPNMDLNRILPLFYEGSKPLFKGTFSIFAFPLAETVVFTMIFHSLKSRKSSFKVYTAGILISAAAGSLITLSVILTLGIDFASSVYFPSYVTISKINIGNFIQRLEITIAVVYLLAGFIKICICLLAVCNGISKVFGYKDYRFLVVPVALLMLNLSYFVYGSLKESYQWAIAVWPYYAFPFQVILPVVILIICELKIRNQHR